MKFVSVLATCLMLSACTFYQKQRDQDRVQEAYTLKEDGLRATLAAHHLDFDHLHLLLVAYKAEGILELHLKHPRDQAFGTVLSYPICAASGELGPKRAQGDRQVPEGFYHIVHFNAHSSYHLSLGINYPNASDKRLSTAEHLGGDIYIHGNCVTIGCLPMTDDKIREIYLLALQARKSGQEQIPVYIFPFRMTAPNMERYGAASAPSGALTDFWQNLQQGYNLLQQHHQLLDVQVDSAGRYVFGAVAR